MSPWHALSLGSVLPCELSGLSQFRPSSHWNKSQRARKSPASELALPTLLTLCYQEGLLEANLVLLHLGHAHLANKASEKRPGEHAQCHTSLTPPLQTH